MIELRAITADLNLGLLDLKEFSKSKQIDIKREQEKAGVNYVLQNLLGTDEFKLFYNASNKPYLEQTGVHISISHSHDKLVVLLNKNENTGVDIELVRDKVLKIKHKFVNEQESLLAGADIDLLITIWAAKEAMYKFYGLKNLDFIKNLSVEDFDLEVFSGNIVVAGFRKKLKLKKEKIENYMLVYILNEVID